MGLSMSMVIFGHILKGDILYQTRCVGAQQNGVGVAKRKNSHLFEVARSLLFTMNVP